MADKIAKYEKLKDDYTKKGDTERAAKYAKFISVFGKEKKKAEDAKKLAKAAFDKEETKRKAALALKKDKQKAEAKDIEFKTMKEAQDRLETVVKGQKFKYEKDQKAYLAMKDGADKNKAKLALDEWKKKMDEKAETLKKTKGNVDKVLAEKKKNESIAR